jgi:hypothetical protein
MAKRQTGKGREADTQGPKTHRRFIQQLRSAPAEESREERLARERSRGAAHGKRRLVEDRQQHDEGEKNSEQKRLFGATERGRADRASDHSGSLHGVLGHRGHRSDYKQRGPDGLRRRGRA